MNAKTEQELRIDTVTAMMTNAQKIYCFHFLAGAAAVTDDQSFLDRFEKACQNAREL